jgi:YVTN family beta-propeller protein
VLSLSGVTDRPHVEVDLLGPLACRVDGRPVQVGSRKQRDVLAVLALQASEVVSTDRLISALWGEEPPPAAKNSLEAHVSRLRKLLAEHGAPTAALRTASPGYALDAATDVASFERSSAAAAAHAEKDESDRAAQELTTALSLWRGSALADLVDEPFAPPEIARLEGLRLDARENLARCRLTLGEELAVIPELEALVAANPLREGPRELLMLALYRAGRQADALELYRDTRCMLQEELGLEPSFRLRELEQAMLRHDPALRGSPFPEAAEAASPLEDVPAKHNGRRSRALLGAASIVAAAAIAAALALATGGSAKPVAVVPNSVAVLDPRTNRVVADIPVGRRPTALAVGEGGIWVLNADDKTVQKIDPARDRVVRTTGVPDVYTNGIVPNLTVGEGAVWVGQEKTVLELDPSYNSPAQDIAAPLPAVYHPSPIAVIAVGAGSLWVASGPSIIRIDASNGRVQAQGIDDPLNRPALMAFHDGALWLLGGGLARIDPGTNAGQLLIPNVAAVAHGFALDSDGIWANASEGLYRIDPSGTRVTAVIDVGPRPGGVAARDGYGVWAASTGDSAVYRVDPTTNKVVKVIRLSVRPDAVTAGYGRIWISVY